MNRFQSFWVLGAAFTFATYMLPVLITNPPRVRSKLALVVALAFLLAVWPIFWIGQVYWYITGEQLSLEELTQWCKETFLFARDTLIALTLVYTVLCLLLSIVGTNR